MLTTYLTRPQTRERYRSGPAGPYLEGYLDWLEQRGYHPPRIRRLLRGVQQFSLWVQHGTPSAHALDPTALASFRQHLESQQRLRQPSGNYSHLFVGARLFVTFLASTPGAAPGRASHPMAALPPVLVAFQQWMHAHRGTTAATLHHYRLP